MDSQKYKNESSVYYILGTFLQIFNIDRLILTATISKLPQLPYLINPLPLTFYT